MDIHGMDSMASPHEAKASPSMDDGMKKMAVHMTFFWGKDGNILFSGWPGTSTGMYALALLLIFALAILVEFLYRCQLVREQPSSLFGSLLRTVAHAVRVGLAYLIMLALMSFNGGVFLVAVLGHAVGFLFFGSGVFRKLESPPYVKASDPIAGGC
ncbi:hypothetical protein SAY87_016682 [Trapa incisa]|uniref:Copper transport protein n=1 Tax=Trapa incisa TaxID=236973 RepID=A0AAN7LHB7_9MYRT|nr:hypothetical protein SAY87_016682 [Trapa incisa]